MKQYTNVVLNGFLAPAGGDGIQGCVNLLGSRGFGCRIGPRSLGFYRHWSTMCDYRLKEGKRQWNENKVKQVAELNNSHRLYTTPAYQQSICGIIHPSIPIAIHPSIPIANRYTMAFIHIPCAYLHKPPSKHSHPS